MVSAYSRAEGSSEMQLKDSSRHSLTDVLKLQHRLEKTHIRTGQNSADLNDMWGYGRYRHQTNRHVCLFTSCCFVIAPKRGRLQKRGDQQTSIGNIAYTYYIFLSGKFATLRESFIHLIYKWRTGGNKTCCLTPDQRTNCMEE